MVTVYVGSFPPDPEADLNNFQRKQAEYAAAWRCTGDPLALYEALLNAAGYLQFPRADLDWLMIGMGAFVTKSRMKGERKGKVSQTVERFQDRMRHVRRYRCVRAKRVTPKSAPWIWRSQCSKLQAKQPRGGRPR